MNLLLFLTEQKLITPPAWLPANTMYLTTMGSHAYGVADTTTEEVCDLDRCIVVPGRAESVLEQIRELIEKAGD